MRLPTLRASILGIVLAASPASLSGEFLLPPSNGYLVLAASDVLACDPPSSVPPEAADAYLHTGFSADDTAPIWRADIYDLADCLRRNGEAI